MKINIGLVPEVTGGACEVARLALVFLKMLVLRSRQLLEVFFLIVYGIPYVTQRIVRQFFQKEVLRRDW